MPHLLLNNWVLVARGGGGSMVGGGNFLRPRPRYDDGSGDWYFCTPFGKTKSSWNWMDEDGANCSAGCGYQQKKK